MVKDESIRYGFKIIQGPDLEHLLISFEPTFGSSQLNDIMLSFKLYPKTPIEEAKRLEDMLNNIVEALLISNYP